MNVESVETLLDGTQRTACKLQVEIEAGTKQDTWISFGEVRPSPEHGWEAVRTRTHCGRGSFEGLGEQHKRLFGTPYVILDFEATPTVLHTRTLRLKADVQIRRLSGFDKEGIPLYRKRIDNRDFDLGTHGEVALPILISDDREEQAFAAYEVLLRVKARAAGHTPPAEYGTVAVTADVPGAEIFVDGGFVGRTSEGSPTVVTNILAGRREVRVRDFSGREAHADLVVESGRDAETHLRILNLPTAGESSDQVSIEKNPQGHEEYWRFRDGAMTVRVPAGEFVMGAEDSSEANERPLHTVYVSEFQIDKTEVTWRQFRKFLQATGAPTPPAPLWGALDDYAVSNVTWNEAAAYCAWVGGRLPTEAEWEKAARGTDGRRYPWGNDYELARCNTLEGGPHRPYSVGSFRECLSPYGVLDLAGSVWEWCADRYGDNYYAEGSSQDPSGPASGTMRVLRGGAWVSQRVWVRAAYRLRRSPGMRFIHFGFRCVQDVDE